MSFVHLDATIGELYALKYALRPLKSHNIYYGTEIYRPSGYDWEVKRRLSCMELKYIGQVVMIGK